MSKDAASDRGRPTQPTQSAGSALDWGLRLEPGNVLGDRYQIRSLLGCGGMGEVWHAFDLKLRVEVALKALRPEFFKSERRLELLRQEVRAAREVVSPNVCRIFDLIEIEGHELVSMEFVDGDTLLEALKERGPLDLKEAQDIATQFLSGLEAVHQAGFIHRDIKPENIMLTRTGRVVVMDFGLAREESEGSGSVAGTPAYMAPEQTAGQTLDTRADVYAAGVVLAEMVSPDGIKSFESRQSVWEGVRSEPAKVPDTPWAAVIKKAVAKDREGRFNSAHTLTRALEDVTLRVEGAEYLRPYPGLASFTEADAEYFFGREAEVERMWRKLEGPPRLFAIMGPSGAGKSSFIAAGLVAHAPSDWAIIRATPGNAAISSLAAVVARETAGDPDAVELLPRFDDPDVAVEILRRWRKKSEHSLLIVDQFEELFTQNSDDEKRRFADLLSRIVLEGDIHVLLSMRDDFAALCHHHEPLRPIFHELTVIDPPTGGNLRRALTRPAQKCGYRFEDDGLVEEMLAEVEDERGALPLLAFAAAQLWERRDREAGLLTREVYQEIGGVGGALARHAEATVDRIGPENLPIVRELFRNLVTANGTRAVREWNELLTVFRDSRSESRAEEVLRALIDARLLTSYEVREGDEAPTRRIEIIHESLLANWPRLVRWQTQDADAAQLRDQLRQAARTWDEQGQTDDTLWTGSAYREFAVWRERYPGGLTDTEEAFATAMTSLATRRRRRRKLAVAAVFALLLAVLVVVGGFWRRSFTEARRAEAANLLSLGQLALDKHPSATVAYAIASLERTDNSVVRRLAVKALSLGPTEFRLPTPAPYMFSLDFSTDGRWLATAEPGGTGSLWPSDGGPPRVLEDSDLAGELRISPTGDLIAATMRGGQELGLWSFPEGRFLHSLSLGDWGDTFIFHFSPDGERLFTRTEGLSDSGYEILVRSWPVAGGTPSLLARLGVPDESAGALCGTDPTCSHLAWTEGHTVHIARLEGTTVHLDSATTIEHDRFVSNFSFDQQGKRLATADITGVVRIWSLETDPPKLLHSPPGGWWGGTNQMLQFGRTGTLLADMGGVLWDLTAPPDTEPMLLRHPDLLLNGLALAPDDTWLATTAGDNTALWPLGRTYPRVLRGPGVTRLAFSPEGDRLVSVGADGSVLEWPLDSGSGERSRFILRGEESSLEFIRISMARDGSFMVGGTRNGQVAVLPLNGGRLHMLGEPGSGDADIVTALAVGPRGRFVAAGAKGLIRLWDVKSGGMSILDPGDGERIRQLEFTDNGDLWAASKFTLRRWSLVGAQRQTKEKTDLRSPGLEGAALLDIDFASRQALRLGDRLWIQDIDTQRSRGLESHGAVRRCGFHADGALVFSTDMTGEVRIGPASGEDPHLLLGHEAEVNAIAVSPDGRWIATGSDDETIRLWPMPDFSKPPLHTLPPDQLIAKLKTLTNLRVARDPESPTGWMLTHDPFPGWETVPEW